MTTFFITPGFLCLSVLCVSSLVACGGGSVGDTDPPRDADMPTAQPAAASGLVALEGCVVDHNFVPRPQVIIATLGDGRLIGSAMANADGIFSLRVPANAPVRIAPEDKPGQTLAVVTGRGNLSVGACLIDLDT